ncbi:MAG TPA: radical SAM protein [Candidatus Obscuribacterales bacterium]
MNTKEVYIYPRPVKTEPLLPVAWCFPNSYQVGMSSLGYQLVWWLLESDPDTCVRRVFTNYQEPGWQAAELFGFTLSWELDYVNVLKALRKAGLSLTAGQRGDACPLVFGGGPVLTANPEPFAEFFDVVLLGDAEAVIPRFLEAWKRIRRLPRRQDRLKELAGIEGIYVPSLYSYSLESPGGPLSAIEPQAAGVPAALGRQVYSPPPDYVAHSVALTPDTAFGDMFLVEIARSCPQECRFCLASYLTRPFRGASVPSIIEKIDLGLTYTSKIGLVGPSVTEHRQFDRIAQALLERPQTQISIASIRADTVSPLVLEMLVRLGQRSVTIALESGSERLRAIMKKNLSEDQVKAAVGLIASSGLQALKFYGMVGLPGETQEDLDQTVRLLTDLKKAHRRLHLAFGLSSFVPKAQTPFQWSGRDRQSKQKLEYLRKHLSRLGMEVRPESHNWSDIQALLSRGDRRLTPLLASVAQGDANLGAWRNALRHLPDGCPGMDFYVWRDIPRDETLPWSHLVDLPKTHMLRRHHQDAIEKAALEPRRTEAAGLS